MIADRFLFTGLARDVARGLDLDWVLKLYQPLLWPDLVFYFAVSPVTSGKRVTATRMPNFYEAGQDVTEVDDPVESYQRFIARVIREYESLALIFNFITVDAEQSIGEQHRQIRELFLRRPAAAVVGLERRTRSPSGSPLTGAADDDEATAKAAADRRRRRRRPRRSLAARGTALGAPRRAAASAGGTRQACSRISRWPTTTPGAPSARTLLLLYAADLAFRLRWQIRPALAEGRTVVAAPYVDTAVAFGRAAG